MVLPGRVAHDDKQSYNVANISWAYGHRERFVRMAVQVGRLCRAKFHMIVYHSRADQSGSLQGRFVTAGS